MYRVIRRKRGRDYGSGSGSRKRSRVSSAGGGIGGSFGGVQARYGGGGGRTEVKSYITHIQQGLTFNDSSAAQLEMATGNVSPGTTVVNCLTAPKQGAAMYERLGADCRCLQLTVRGRISRYARDATPLLCVGPSTYRVLLVLDKNNNNGTGLADPVGTTNVGVLRQTHGATAESDALLPYNPRTKNRYRILADRTITLPGSQPGNAGRIQMGVDRQFMIRKKLRCTINFGGLTPASEGAAAVTDNAVYMYVIATHESGGSETPPTGRVEVISEMRYVG